MADMDSLDEILELVGEQVQLIKSLRKLGLTDSDAYVQARDSLVIGCFRLSNAMVCEQ